MDVVEVDERDSSWEDPSPRFRVYLYEDRHGSGSYGTRTYDITGADVLETIQWARRAARSRLAARKRRHLRKRTRAH